MMHSQAATMNPLPGPSNVAQLKGHEATVSRVVKLPRVNIIVTACLDSLLRVYDAGTGELRRVLKGHSGLIVALTAIDAHRVASADARGGFRVWDVWNGKWSALNLPGAVSSMAILNSELVIVGLMTDLGRIRVTGKKLQLKVWNDAHEDIIQDIAAGSRYFVTTSMDNSVRVWEPAGTTIPPSLRPSNHSSRVLCVDMDNKYIVTGDDNGDIDFYSIAGRRFERSFNKVHHAAVCAVALVGNESVASFSLDKSVAVVSRLTGAFKAIALGFPVLHGVAVDRDRFVAVGERRNAVVFDSPVFRSETRASSTLRNSCSGPVEHLVDGVNSLMTDDKIDMSIVIPQNGRAIAGHEGSTEEGFRTTPADRTALVDNTVLGKVLHCLQKLQSRKKSWTEKQGAVKEIDAMVNQWVIKRSTIFCNATRLLGNGRDGDVFEGVYSGGSGEPVKVAVKRMTGQWHSIEAKDKERKMCEFYREATLQGGLEHENILKFYGASWPSGPERVNPFFVTELMTKNLADARSDMPDHRTKVWVLLCVARALEYLHKQRVLHQDVAPQNVLLKIENGKILAVKVSDFGQSRVIVDNSTLTRSLRGGHLMYNSPEFLNGEAPSFSWDIWSFGILCGFVFQGETLMDGRNASTVMTDAVMTDAVMTDKVTTYAKSGDLARSTADWVLRIEQEDVRNLALRCVEAEPGLRPEMAFVRKELDGVYSKMVPNR